MTRERQSSYKAEHAALFARPFVRRRVCDHNPPPTPAVGERGLVVERGELLEDGERLISDGNTTQVLKDDHDALDVGTEEIGARLVMIGNKLEREEHGSAKGVERAPVEMSGDGKGTIGEKVRTGLSDKLGETVGGVDGGLEGLLPAGVMDVIPGGGLPWASIGTMQSKADVVEEDAKTEALSTSAADREDGRRERTSKAVVVKIEFRGEGLKPSLENLVLGYDALVWNRTDRDGVVHNVAEGLRETEKVNVGEMETAGGIIGRVESGGELGIKMAITDGERTAEHKRLPSTAGVSRAQVGHKKNVPLCEHNVPPSPATALCDVTGHFPLAGITVETHGDGGADELTAHSPEVLALVLCDGEIVGTKEQKLDELETVSPALSTVALERGGTNVIVVFAEVRRYVGKGLDERMTGREELDGDSEDDKDGGKDETVAGDVGLEASPGVGEGVVV